VTAVLCRGGTADWKSRPGLAVGLAGCRVGWSADSGVRRCKADALCGVFEGDAASGHRLYSGAGRKRDWSLGGSGVLSATS